MWKLIIVITCLIGYCASGPLGSKHHVRFKARQNRDAPLADADRPASTAKMNLPSNATSIRAEIKDGFSCEGRVYGYYADMDNDCQIFHVCMPVAYGDGKEHYFRWSFICPEDTVFSQDSFTCMHRQDMTIDCADSMKYYELNRNFGTMNEENPGISHKISADNEVNEAEIEANETPAAAAAVAVTVEEKVTPKPVKKTKPFSRKPVRPVASAQKSDAIKVEQSTKNKRPTQSHYKRNKPQILRTTAKPIEKVEEIVTEKIIIPQVTEKILIPQVTDKIQINNEELDLLMTEAQPATTELSAVEPQEKATSTTESALTEDTLPTSTLATLTEEEENFLKQTAGGFQDVDPTMAAEAEALINNFLQTMMKTEISAAQQPAIEMDAVADLQPTTEKAEEVVEAIVQEVEDFSKTTEVPIRHELYEIPVTIIHTPLEEIMVQKPQTVTPFKPISIDDVVANVKEHLDKPVGTIDGDSTDSPKPESLAKDEEAEVIVPIYHRLKNEPEMIPVEPIETDLIQTADKSETESQSTIIPAN